MSVTYAIDVQSPADPYISVAQKALYAITAAGNVGTYLVDYIPFRTSRIPPLYPQILNAASPIVKYVPEWFPGAHFQREAREWRESANMMAYKPVADVRKAMVCDLSQVSFLGCADFALVT